MMSQVASRLPVTLKRRRRCPPREVRRRSQEDLFRAALAGWWRRRAAAVQILNALDAVGVGSVDIPVQGEGPYLSDVSPSVRLHSGNQQSRFGRWRALRRFISETQPDVVVSFLSYFTVLSAVRAAGSVRASSSISRRRCPRFSPTATIHGVAAGIAASSRSSRARDMRRPI